MLLQGEDMDYMIARGNNGGHFEIVREHGISALHFRHRLKKPGKFRIVIHGRPRDTTATKTEWEKPLTFTVHLVVTEWEWKEDQGPIESREKTLPDTALRFFLVNFREIVLSYGYIKY